MLDNDQVSLLFYGTSLGLNKVKVNAPELSWIVDSACPYFDAIRLKFDDYG
jgi:hypothetical protein